MTLSNLDDNSEAQKNSNVLKKILKRQIFSLNFTLEWNNSDATPMKSEIEKSFSTTFFLVHICVFFEFVDDFYDFLVILRHNENWGKQS